MSDEAGGPMVTVDPCQPLRVAGPHADAALALWGLVARADPGPADLSIVPAAGGGVELGYYDDTHATIDVSDTLDDATATVVVAHELGHAFGLLHVARADRASVMNPGNIAVTPTLADRGALGCAPR